MRLVQAHNIYVPMQFNHHIPRRLDRPKDAPLPHLLMIEQSKINQKHLLAVSITTHYQDPLSSMRSSWAGLLAILHC